jgi:flagellin
MAAFINTNTSSLNSQRNLSTSQASLTTSLQRLSSGLRINSAKDDAAGLSIATKMDTQVRGMSQAIRNANDGISLSQTADGALATATEALQRMRELAVQGVNGTNNTEDSANLDKEYQALGKEVLRLTTDTKFNGKDILTTAAAATDIQVGANTGQTITIAKIDLETIAKTLNDGTATAVTDLTTAAKSTAAITALDTALKNVTGLRADLGATQNRFSYSISNLQSSVENQSAAKSRIMDTDFAAETASMTRGQILQQAGTAMLAQANSLPNGVLALLRG